MRARARVAARLRRRIVATTWPLFAALYCGATVAAAQRPAQDSPADAVATADATAAAQELETFDVWEYRVLGATVLEPPAVEGALYGHLGPGKTIEDVETARQALEAAFRAGGFNTVFVDIPEQTVDRGVVRLNVTEGKLDRVRVTGARYFSNRRILARLPALQAGGVPEFARVQTELAALNRETPDRAVTPVLRAGRFPGTVDMELRVQDDLPLHGSVETNDRYSANTSELRASVNLGYHNLWQRAHSASLQYQTAPEEPEEAEVLAGTYIARFERTPAILALYAVDTSSDVATLGALSVLGKGTIFGARAIRPMEPVGSFFHNLTFGLDLKDFDEAITVTEDEDLATAIKYNNWSASYGFGWTLPKSTSEFSVGAAWGVRGLGNDDAEFEEKRFKARANYLYLTGAAAHSREVFGAARFVTRLNWQYANTPLISNEQFSVGGATSVRSYLEAEQLGDLGMSLSAELHSPSFLRTERIVDLHMFGFVDLGSVAIEDPLPDQDSRGRLLSAGAGLRFTGYKLLAELDWARALRDGTNVVAGDTRTHFRLSYGF
jgi:hemolysin activation/secretion protein